MTSNQVLSTMFDFNTCNLMSRFVLRDDGNEDPGSYHLYPGCDEVFIICIDTYMHFVCLGLCMNLISLEHISTVYCWWICRFIMTWIHSIYLVSTTHWIFTIWVWECLPQIMIYYYVDAWFLQVHDRCAPCSTHTFYKVFQLSQVPATYFGGHSVTHYFGHSSDPLTTCFHVPWKDKRVFIHEKSDFLSFLKNHIKEGHHTLQNAWGVMIPDHRTLL